MTSQQRKEIVTGFNVSCVDNTTVTVCSFNTSTYDNCVFFIEAACVVKDSSGDSGALPQIVAIAKKVSGTVTIEAFSLGTLISTTGVSGGLMGLTNITGASASIDQSSGTIRLRYTGVLTKTHDIDGYMTIYIK